MTEPELVKECLKGNGESQRRLYEQYAPKMLGVCYRYAVSKEEAEDFLQEAFIHVFTRLKQYKGEGELGAWIRRIVVNTSLNGIKARHRFSSENLGSGFEDLSGELDLFVPSDGQELMELVHQLPTGCKTVFNLYAIEGYSHEEIAKLLNIKAGTSRSQYMKARRMLLDKLDPEFRNTIHKKKHG